MNFLGHAYLSGTETGILTGNFIGDFVKGKQKDYFPPAIQNGIALHREIDNFTDTHPVVKQSKKRLQSKYRHYAPVIVDMFYDHFLAANWNNWHTESLEKYTESIYEQLASEPALLPDQFNYMLSYMRKTNWLLGYAEIEGIHAALSGMARRTKFASGMETASVDLEANYDAYGEEFAAFFPDIINFVNKFEFVKPL